MKTLSKIQLEELENRLFDKVIRMSIYTIEYKKLSKRIQIIHNKRYTAN